MSPMGDSHSSASLAFLDGIAHPGDVKTSPEFVDKGVGLSPKLIRLGSGLSTIESQLSLNTDSEVHLIQLASCMALVTQVVLYWWQYI